MPSRKDIEEHKINLMSLSLKGFRGFGKLEMDFDNEKPIHVIIADNGGGKTTILDAVAEFLRYFLKEGVISKNVEIPKLLESLKPRWNSTDIKNDEAVALCEATLQLTYKFPPIEVFEIINRMTDFLNEYQLKGKKASLKLTSTKRNKNIHEVWNIFLDDDENDGLQLPTEINDSLDTVIFFSGECLVAQNINGYWTANLNTEKYNTAKHDYTGEIHVRMEINRSGKIQDAELAEKKAGNIVSFIDQLKRKVAFPEDFSLSTNNYIQENSFTVLPLLAYYGGAAINTSFGEINIRYNETPYQAYVNALNPIRFDFKDFFEWLNWINKEDSKYQFAFVKQSILKVLNSDKEIYNDLRIEYGQLRVYKQHSEYLTPLAVEINQLSAGEKNLFALVGDLVKRAVQLNPVLFEVDLDQNEGTFSNPLEYTEGIVLIDEIDLHLHPKWQRQIIPTMRKLFPHVQFIVSTHSPFILQLPNSYYSLFANQNGLFNKIEYGNMAGWTIEEILSEAMDLCEKINSTYYNKLIKNIEGALEFDDYFSAKEYFQKLEPMLHPANTLKKLLRLQIESIKP